LSPSSATTELGEKARLGGVDRMALTEFTEHLGEGLLRRRHRREQGIDRGRGSGQTLDFELLGVKEDDGRSLAAGQLLKSGYDLVTAEPGKFSPFTMGVRQLAKDLLEMRMLDAGRAPKALGVEAEVNELVAVLNKAVFSFPFWDKHGEVDHEFIARLRSYLQRGEQEPVLMSQVALPEDFVMQLVGTPKPLFTPRR